MCPRRKRKKSHSWWCTPVIPALRKLRQMDHKCEVILGYIVKPCPALRIKEGGRKRGKKGEM